MAKLYEGWWQPGDEVDLPRADRKHGRYFTYLPDLLHDRPLWVPAELGAKAARAEREVRALSTGPGAVGLEGLARFLLRSEAIASSLIEGIAPSPQQVALAELSQDESVRGFSDQARLVANNITILRTAARELVATDVVTVADVEALHRVLLPEERHHGLRQVQNWIGGSSWHPLDAQFVPPPAEHVRPLMDDLLAYLNGSVHAPLVQAAVVHAQFETIHPFTDGNGRVGRALIHTVLTRRGLTPSAILPVSLVLATMQDTYVSGLTDYRHEADPTAAEAHAGVAAWLNVFLEATATAAAQAHLFAEQIGDLRTQWEQQVTAHRLRQGVRATPRADSASSRLLAILPEVPILTTRTVQRLLGVSFPPARAGLEELAEAGVLSRRSVEQGTTGYVAKDLFQVLGHAERQLASTRWDTRLSPPSRPAPARPEQHTDGPAAAT